MLRKTLAWRPNLEQRLILIFTAFMIAVLGLGCLYFYLSSAAFFRENEGKALMMMAQSMANFIEAPEHEAVLLASREDTPAYLKLKRILENFRKGNPSVRFAYTMAPLEGKKWQFVVDAEPSDSKDFSAIGSEYDISEQKEIRDALNGPIATKLVTDKFGSWMSGHAPIKNAAGKGIAVVGIDVSAKTILAQEATLRVSSLVIFALGSILSVLLSTWLVRTLILPQIKKNLLLQKLVQSLRG